MRTEIPGSSTSDAMNLVTLEDIRNYCSTVYHPVENRYINTSTGTTNCNVRDSFPFPNYDSSGSPLAPNFGFPVWDYHIHKT